MCNGVIYMNEIIKSLHERKSVRVFEDKEITDDIKKEILMAALQAPSAGCQQLYTIIDVTDEKLKYDLSKSCDNQPFIADAKMVLVFCADCKKWYDAYIEGGCKPREPGVGDLLLAVSDANIAAQNAVVAASSFGIGSCYIGDIMENYERQRELLNLPDYVFPCAMLVFGYPTIQQQNRLKPERFDLKYMVHQNQYHTMESSELREMFKFKHPTSSFEDWINAFCNRKYNSDFSKEMTRSVEEYLKHFKF